MKNLFNSCLSRIRFWYDPFIIHTLCLYPIVLSCFPWYRCPSSLPHTHFSPLIPIIQHANANSEHFLLWIFKSEILLIFHCSYRGRSKSYTSCTQVFSDRFLHMYGCGVVSHGADIMAFPFLGCPSLVQGLLGQIKFKNIYQLLIHWKCIERK